jgi:hypothetical protein
MKLKMAAYLILIIFTLSFIAPFTQTTIAAEKPKPEQKENDTLDDVKTGVKVNAGMIGNIAGFSNLMLEIEQGNAGSKAAITVNAALLTAGFAKVFDDATGGQQNRSKVFEYSGYFGDAGELLGKSIDASGAIGTSYSNLHSKGLVSQTGNLSSKFWQSTKYGFTKFTGGVRDAFGTVGFKETTRTAWSGTKSQVKSIPVLNKILAPLAVVGAWVDFSDAVSLSQKTKKDNWKITEKVLSGISNVLVVAGLLAAGTAGAPLLAVAALATGAAALTIKYWGPISKGAKKGWNYISKKVTSGAKAVAKGAKAAGSYLKAKGIALGNKAKDAWKSGISKAKAFGAKAGTTIKNAGSKAYQFMKNKAGQAKKGLSKAAKTISAATKKAFEKAKSAASKAKKTVTSAVKKTVSKGVKAFSNAKKTISASVKKTASKASKTITTAVKKVTSKAKTAVSKVTKPLSNAKKTITTAAKKVTKKAHSYTQKVTKSVSSASKKAYSYAKKATSTVKKAASKPVSYAKKAVTSVKSATKSTYSYAKKAASTVKKTVSKSVSSYGKKVSSAVKSTASKSYSYVSKTASSAKKAVKSVASSAKKKVSSVAKGVTSFFKKPKFRW